MDKKNIHMVTFLLMVIGGLNWGLVGLFDFNLVSAVLGSWPLLETVVYILVALSALYELVKHKEQCGVCSDSKK